MSTFARLTLDEYDRLIDAAVFNPERRIELVHGELREMSPIGDRHRDTVNALTNDWAMVLKLTAGVRSRLTVQVQSPIRLPAQQSAPHPDMSWIAREPSDATPPGADEVFLVIEVADSSLAGDRGEKADLYAEAGIPDYWIVNLVDDCIEIRREPKGGRYQSVTIHRAGDEVRPLLFPDCPLRVALLFD
jgi:Uma2 family endonuclease